MYVLSYFSCWTRIVDEDGDDMMLKEKGDHDGDHDDDCGAGTPKK